LVEERVSAEKDTAENAATDSETVEAERDTAEGVATERCRVVETLLRACTWE